MEACAGGLTTSPLVEFEPRGLEHHSDSVKCGRVGCGKVFGSVGLPLEASIFKLKPEFRNPSLVQVVPVLLVNIAIRDMCSADIQRSPCAITGPHFIVSDLHIRKGALCVNGDITKWPQLSTLHKLAGP